MSNSVRSAFWTSRYVVKASLVGMIVCFATVFPGYYHYSDINMTYEQLQDMVNRSLCDNHAQCLGTVGLSLAWGAISSALLVGNFFGTFPAAWLANRVGLKPVIFVLAPLLQTLGSALQSTAVLVERAELLLVGRFISGLPTGATVVLIPVYLTEISPVEIRGFMGSLVSASAAMGIFSGMMLGSDKALGAPNRLPLLLSVAPIASSCVGIILHWFLPESPKYLYLIKDDYFGAYESLEYFGANDGQLGTIIESYRLEDQEQEQNQAKGIKGLKLLITNSSYRRVLEYSLLSATADVTTGCGPLASYSTIVFANIGLDAFDIVFYASVQASVILTTGILAPVVVERLGRRTTLKLTLFVISLLLFGLFVAALASSLYTPPDDRIFINLSGVIVCLLAAFYGFGPNSVVFSLPAEISPQIVKGSVVSLNASYNRIASMLTSWAFVPLLNTVGAYSFLVYATLTFLCCIGLQLLYIPEPKGKTMHEFMKKLAEKTNAGDKTINRVSPIVYDIADDSSAVLNERLGESVVIREKKRSKAKSNIESYQRNLYSDSMSVLGSI